MACSWPAARGQPPGGGAEPGGASRVSWLQPQHHRECRDRPPARPPRLLGTLRRCAGHWHRPGQGARPGGSGRAARTSAGRRRGAAGQGDPRRRCTPGGSACRSFRACRITGRRRATASRVSCSSNWAPTWQNLSWPSEAAVHRVAAAPDPGGGADVRADVPALCQA